MKKRPASHSPRCAACGRFDDRRKLVYDPNTFLAYHNDRERCGAAEKLPKLDNMEEKVFCSDAIETVTKQYGRLFGETFAAIAQSNFVFQPTLPEALALTHITMQNPILTKVNVFRSMFDLSIDSIPHPSSYKNVYNTPWTNSEPLDLEPTPKMVQDPKPLPKPIPEPKQGPEPVEPEKEEPYRFEV